MKRAAKGLKKGGYLVVIDCAHQWLFGPHDVNNMARQRYSKAELVQKVEATGLEVVRSSYLFMFAFPLFVSTRLWQKWTGNINETDAQNDWQNKLLTTLGKLEAKLLRYTNLPFGSSIVVIAQKK